ncbi:MAG: helix-turn-helix domain-containing protein [Vicinamibacterales bacterium]|jgi:predicted XRE-type DNA-binding protein|nr:helix-turn-helix domain-containing protein [Vicinamibacterales bacterium]
MAKRTTAIALEASGGNVFADLGLPNPEQELLKARLTLQIDRIIKARQVTQVQAGAILGIRQPQVSLLMRNRSGPFSVERLMDFLTALGHDGEVRLTPTRKAHGQLSVVVAAQSACLATDRSAQIGYRDLRRFALRLPTSGRESTWSASMLFAAIAAWS